MKRALVLVADGSEEIEAVTVVDILRRAGVEVVVAGLGESPITASRGVCLVPDQSIDEQRLETFDLLVLPGGNGGTERFERDARVLELVREAVARPIMVGAICAAPRALLRAGVLSGKRVTSYPGALDATASDYTYLQDSVVEDGWLITSRGPGTAMDFALALVARLCGDATRHKVEAALIRP